MWSTLLLVLLSGILSSGATSAVTPTETQLKGSVVMMESAIQPDSKTQKILRFNELQKTRQNLTEEAELLYMPISRYNTLKATNPNLGESEDVKQARLVLDAKRAEFALVEAEIEQLRIDLGL